MGGLIYAMLCTRLDIAYVVSVTSKYQSNSGMEHWTTVKQQNYEKIIYYLKDI